MTEIEARIILNQCHILTALTLLVPNPLRNNLIETAQENMRYVEKHHGNFELDRG